MHIVIIHGSFGSPQGNWFPWLKAELEKKGHRVLVPAFPVDTWERITELGENHPSEIQSLENWTKIFEKEVLPSLETNEPLAFIGHSLAPVFILHMVEKYNINLTKAIFVAPFLEHLGRSWQIDVVNKSFYKTDFDFEKLQKLIPHSFVVYSDNDPHVPIERAKAFAKALHSEEVLVKGGGHLNESAGYKEFPLLLKLID